MLHAKMLIVDENWSSVGSVNSTTAPSSCTTRSTLCVQSERFAGQLHEVFDSDLERSERIEPRVAGAPDDPAGARERDQVRTARALAPYGPRVVRGPSWPRRELASGGTRNSEAG